MKLHQNRFWLPVLAVTTACLTPLGFAQTTAPAESRAPSREALTPTAAERDARLGWWRDARFGMFVHWGVYAGLGGTWHGKAYGGYAEHIQRMAKIPIPVYRQEVAGAFNPLYFDADEWMRRAKQTGMGYLIITAKHHDGFAMFASKVSDYNIVQATPFHHDPMKELRAAARKYGVKFGFYYSHAFDWGEANGPGNDWDYQNPGGDKLLHGANWWENYPEFLPKARQYVDEKSIPQILELIANYDPDILWFDTPHKLPPEENLRILAAVRKAKPSLVVNGRIVYGCGDYANTSDGPAEFPPTDGDWEGIPTTNQSYGYNKNDHSHKPPAFFIRLLAKAAARGGNVLMNIGPRGDGTFDPTDVAILEGIGHWWQVNGESIRGTTRTPLPVQAYGESTRKGNRLYLHVFNWPRDGQLAVGGLTTGIVKAALLAQPNLPLQVTGTTITVPTNAPDAADSVVAVDCAGEPKAEPVRLLVTNIAEDTLRSFDARLEGGLKYGSGTQKSAWVGNWTSKGDAVVWPLTLRAPAKFDVAVVYDAPAAAKASTLKDGDAGKELVRAHGGAGGTYRVQFGPQTWEKTVRNGGNVNEALGQITLPPGSYELRVSAVEITGEELMRLSRVTLSPSL